MQTDNNMFTLHGINFNQAVKLIKNSEEIVVAYLYGSALSEYFRPDSDIDIALLLNPGTDMSSYKKLQLSGELSSLLNREVHLGIMSKNTLVFTKEIIEKGLQLFTKNDYFSNLYNATVLSMYAQLRENNQEVINAYSNR